MEGFTDRPFAQLVHFKVDRAHSKPRVLLLSPLVGMRAGILSDMVSGLLDHHDVYCLIWKDAGDIPVEEGPFGLEHNIRYVVESLTQTGRAHVIGLCQSALPALAATAIVASEPNRPATLTLLGGKLDTRINPTRLDSLARRYPLSWFEEFVVTTVPSFRRGHGRRVYPATTELMMLSVYLMRNLWSGGELFRKILYDDGADPVHHSFLRSFFAVADIPAEFFLDTIACVFHNSALAQGGLTWKGTKIAPENILDTALFTIEGELDDISGLGQTHIAHDLCPRIPPGWRERFHCRQAGHLGLFYGDTWRREVLPRVISFIRQHD